MVLPYVAANAVAVAALAITLPNIKKKWKEWNVRSKKEVCDKTKGKKIVSKETMTFVESMVCSAVAATVAVSIRSLRTKPPTPDPLLPSKIKERREIFARADAK